MPASAYDYTSMGFYTFDCLGWPFTAIPPGGACYPIDELTLAVSGAAGTATIAAAKMGLRTLAVGNGSNLLLGIAFNPVTGDLLVADLGKQQVLKVDPQTGASSVFASIPGGGPNAFAFDAAGNVYVSDSFQATICAFRRRAAHRSRGWPIRCSEPPACRRSAPTAWRSTATLRRCDRENSREFC